MVDLNDIQRDFHNQTMAKYPIEDDKNKLVVVDFCTYQMLCNSVGVEDLHTYMGIRISVAMTREYVVIGYVKYDVLGMDDR